MNMPEMNGKDSFIEMKNTNPEIKAVLVTGFSNSENTEGILNEGIYDILHKPFKLSQIKNLIDRISGDY